MQKVTVSALVVAALLGLPTTFTVAATDGPSPRKLPLLQRTDLGYLGAFLLPASSLDRTSFSYGGTALAYNPARNSLFLVGHAWYQRTDRGQHPATRQAIGAERAPSSVVHPAVRGRIGRDHRADRAGRQQRRRAAGSWRPAPGRPRRCSLVR